MTQLLAADHPTVIRRLVRELNQNGWQRSRAFYVEGEKYTQARYRNGQLECCFCGHNWKAVSPLATFGDGGGDTIVARRAER